MNYKIYNDYELVSMVREKNDDCADLLYKKYYPIIRKSASDFYQKYKYYGYELDDFVQEALIAFQMAILSFDESKDSMFYSYICLCIQRRLISFCRNISCSSKNISSNKFVELEDNITIDSHSDLNSVFEEREYQEICKRVIFSLPFDVGCILELKLNGFTYKEISKLLDVPCSTIEFRNRKGKEALKIAFKKYYCK